MLAARPICSRPERGPHSNERCGFPQQTQACMHTTVHPIRPQGPKTRSVRQRALLAPLQTRVSAAHPFLLTPRVRVRVTVGHCGSPVSVRYRKLQRASTGCRLHPSIAAPTPAIGDSRRTVGATGMFSAMIYGTAHLFFFFFSGMRQRVSTTRHKARRPRMFTFISLCSVSSMAPLLFFFWAPCSITVIRPRCGCAATDEYSRRSAPAPVTNLP